MPRLAELQPAVIAQINGEDGVSLVGSSVNGDRITASISVRVHGHERTLHLDADDERWRVAGPDGQEIIGGELGINDTYRVGPPAGQVGEDKIRAVGVTRAAERIVSEVLMTAPE